MYFIFYYGENKNILYISEDPFKKFEEKLKEELHVKSRNVWGKLKDYSRGFLYLENKYRLVLSVKELLVGGNKI